MALKGMSLSRILFLVLSPIFAVHGLSPEFLSQHRMIGKVMKSFMGM